jgi:prenyltransferase beta subunit
MKKIIRLTESDLTRIVKRVIKENSAKDDLIQMIKNDGWDNTSEIVGGDENLKNLTGINSTMDFLNLYDDLNSLDDKHRPTWKMFFHNIDNPIMMLISNTDDGNKAYMSTSLIFNIRELFGNMSFELIRTYIKQWLKDVYGFDVNEEQIISRRGYPFNQFRSEEITG